MTALVKVPMKFKLLTGLHITDDPTGAKHPATGKPLEKVYRAGEIVPSTVDLTKLLLNKFERVHDSTPLTETFEDVTVPKKRLEKDLNKMSINDLKQLAAEEEISIDSLTTKEQIIKVIQAAIS